MKHKKKLIIALGLISLMAVPPLFGKSSVLVFITDLYNQRGIKPQEKGSMMDFPWGSVDTQGRTVRKAGDFKMVDGAPEWDARERNAGSATKNPVEPTAESIANGEALYNTFCAGCHGVNGDGASKVSEKGIGAPPIAYMTKPLTDGFIYHKIKDASGQVMPPLGYATTERERWDIVNYIRAKLEK